MSKETVLKGQTIKSGIFEGEAVVSQTPFGFYGAVDPATGAISDKRHELYGQVIADKVFIFPEGRGSTAGAIVILELARCGTCPGAIINCTTEPILATGVILAEKFYNKKIVTVHQLNRDPTEITKNGDKVVVDGDRGEVVIK